MDSRLALLRAARARLHAAAEARGDRDGAEHAADDALLLLERALCVPRASLLAASDEPVGAADAARVRDWTERFAAGEPLAYLEGVAGFRRLDLAVDPRVLVPRADSEALVELALECLDGGGHARLVDVGTGSGCLLLALLDESPRTQGLGLDYSGDALEVAAHNARRCGLESRAALRLSDWLSAAEDASADLVVSNPPYIEPDEALGPGVAEHEPHLALFTPAGDPLFAYRAILEQAPRVLRPDGKLVFEVGAGRADAVSALAAELGFGEYARRRDLGGIERALAFARA